MSEHKPRPPRFPWPERGELRINGVRQYLEEDLDYLLALARSATYHEAVVRLDEDEKRRRHIEKLRDAYSTERSAFIQKWNKP